jgi:hypothetical protein
VSHVFVRVRVALPRFTAPENVAVFVAVPVNAKSPPTVILEGAKVVFAAVASKSIVPPFIVKRLAAPPKLFVPVTTTVPALRVNPPV